ncbi:MAG: hypothetical protein ACOYM2_14000 [Rectinemataceae bacterium]
MKQQLSGWEISRSARILPILPSLETRLHKSAFRIAVLGRNAFLCIQCTGLGSNVQQLLGDKNPEKIGDSGLLFRIKFEVSLKTSDGSSIGLVAIAYAVFFELKDPAAFYKLWEDEQLRSTFQQQQLQKTLWPYLRQFVSESLLRLELPGLTLPWLL